MLQNAYFLAKIGADTAKNEQHFAEILPSEPSEPDGEAPRAASAPLGAEALVGRRRFHPARGAAEGAVPGAPGLRGQMLTKFYLSILDNSILSTGRQLIVF